MTKIAVGVPCLPDLDALADCLYEAAFNQAHWESALQTYAEAFGGIGVAILQLDAGPPVMAVSPGSLETAIRYNEGWWQFDTIRATSDRLGYSRKPGTYWDDDYIAATIKAKDQFFQDFFRPFGVSGVASMVAQVENGDRFAINVQRRFGAPPPDDAERARFTAVSRHLARALTIRLRLMRAEAVEKSLFRGLSRFDCAVAILDRSSRVTQTNEAFDALDAEGLSVRLGRLRTASPVTQARLEGLLADMTERGRASRTVDTLVLPRPDSLLPLLLRAVPLTGGASEQLLGIMPMHGVLVMVLNPTHRAYPDLSKVLVALGLTPAQARVSLVMASGCTTKQAAELLAISDETVRTTLKNVYARLGFTKQSDLVRLIAKSAPFGA